VFNTRVSSKLITELRTLGLNTSLCNWILDFLTGCPQVVRVGINTSVTLILNTGAIIKFSDDTTVVGLIINNDETAYKEVVRDLAVWCQDNNLSLNMIKTKEMILDYRKRRAEYTPILINGAVVEQVESFKFLGFHIKIDYRPLRISPYLLRYAIWFQSWSWVHLSHAQGPKRYHNRHR
jgi:hypothetical protein